MDPITFILVLIAGIFFGILATFVGIGGGLLNVPFLYFVMDLPASSATLVSSFVIMFTSSSGFLKYNKLNRIDFKTALIYLALAIPGSFLGGYVAENIEEELIRQLFALLIGISAIRGLYKAYTTRGDKGYQPDNVDDMETQAQKAHQDTEKFKDFREKKRIITDTEGDIFEYEVKLNIGIAFAFLGGFVAGLLGVGGGIIFVPVLSAISGVPIHIAVATSTTMIVVVSVIAVITRFSIASAAGTLVLSDIINYGIPLALGSIVGAYIGAAKVKKISSKQLIALFWVIALFAAVRMYLS